MKRIIKIIITLLVLLPSYGQQLAVNCDLAMPGCTTPSFPITGTNPPYDITDFNAGTFSNPSTNPNPTPGNMGCLLTGETVSTFITIYAITSGTLEWSIQGPTSGFFDWIMWPYNANACNDLWNNNLAPVACNWNLTSAGFTGMAAPGNLPPGANQGNFEYALNVNAGDQFLLCLSNYSGTNQNVNLNFFGSATIACGVSAPDQTICVGSSANVTINTAGLSNPTFNWLVTTGVSNPTGGTNVTVTPTTTTTYQVEVVDNTTTPPVIDTATFTIYVEQPPTPNAGQDQNVCFTTPTTTLNLNGVSSNPSNTVLWTYSTTITPPPVVNIANNTAATTTATVNQQGVYDFYLTETSAICGSVTDTVQFLVSDLTVSATFQDPTCNGGNDGQITISSMGAIDYSFDNGATWSPTPTMTGLSSGTYDVCARNIYGCMGCTTVVLTDPAPVVVTVSNDTTMCQNATANLVASATGGSNFQYHWDFTTNTSPNQSVSPMTTTSYTVYAENEFGCISATETVIVNVLPPLTGTISTIDDTICPTFSTDIMANVSGGMGQPYTFVWSNGETFTGQGSDAITVTPLQTTTYTVTISDGCETTPITLSIPIVVAPLPVPQYVVLNPVQCDPAEFIIVNTTDPTMSQSVDWVVAGHHFINQDTIYVPPLSAGDYDLDLTITSFEGCLDSISVENALHVNPLPEALFHFHPDPVTMLNTEVHFTNFSIDGDTYQWYFENGTPYSSTQKNPVIVFPEGIIAEYEVMLITTSPLGCVDTLVKTIKVEPEVIIYAPNTFTPDGDEFNQNWKIYIEGIDIYDVELLIYNRWGEVVWESHDLSVGWDGTYKGKVVPDGTYIWTLKAADPHSDDKFRFKGFVNIIR